MARLRLRLPLLVILAAIILFLLSTYFYLYEVFSLGSDYSSGIIIDNGRIIMLLETPHKAPPHWEYYTSRRQPGFTTSLTEEIYAKSRYRLLGFGLDLATRDDHYDGAKKLIVPAYFPILLTTLLFIILCRNRPRASPTAFPLTPPNV